MPEEWRAPPPTCLRKMLLGMRAHFISTNRQMAEAACSSGMILAQGARGPGFNSRSSPSSFVDVRHEYLISSLHGWSIICVTACVCGFGNSRMAQFRRQKTIIRQGRAQRTPRHVSQHRVAHRWRQRRPRQLICRYGWGHAELVRRKVVPRGLEPRTLRLLAVRSNQLSYETICAILQF